MKEYNLRNSEDIKKEFKENLISFIELIDDKDKKYTDYGVQYEFAQKAFSFLENLDEAGVRIAKSELNRNIEEMYQEDSLNYTEIVSFSVIEDSLTEDNYEKYRFPETYSDEMRLNALRNNPSVLKNEINDYNSKNSEKTVDELTDLYEKSAIEVIKDIMTDLKFDLDKELCLGDLEEIYNKIETDIEKKEKGSFSLEEIEENKAIYKSSLENSDKEY
jgi:hypothetical protein